MEQNCAESKRLKNTHFKERVLCIFSRVLVYLINKAKLTKQNK